MNKFDELAKSLAQPVTRRGALKNFGLGLTAIALAALGLSNKAEAKPPPYHCHCNKPDYGCAGTPNPEACYLSCPAVCQNYLASAHKE